MALPPPPDDRAEARAPARPGSSGERGPGPIVGDDPSSLFGAILQATWLRFHGQVASCLAACWGAAAANWLIVMTCRAVLSGLIEVIGEPAFGEFARFLLFLADIIVPIWLQIGLNLALLKMARSEPMAFDDLFRGGPYLLTTILATLVILSIAAAPLLVAHFLVERILDRSPVLTPLLSAFTLLSLAGAPPAIIERVEILITMEFDREVISGILAGLAGVVLVSPVVLAVLARLGQSSYLILDQGAGVVGSLQGSWRLTRGRRFAAVIAVYLAYLAINGAGLLAFCVGMIFTLPMTSLLLVMTYRALSEGAPALVPAHPEIGDEAASS
jgi:hypothetical protein